MKKNEKGFSVIEVLILVVVVGLLGVVGWLVYSGSKNSSPSIETSKKEASTTADTTNSSTSSSVLLAGDFGTKGQYGTFQVEGYAKVLKELYDINANCGMSNPGVECPKIDGVYFMITKLPNEKALAYIKSVSEIQATNSLVMGCPTSGTITYSNASDKVSKSYTINENDTTKILASTAEKPIRLEITKDEHNFGKDAPNCYSHFTNYKVLN